MSSIKCRPNFTHGFSPACNTLVELFERREAWNGGTLSVHRGRVVRGKFLENTFRFIHRGLRHEGESWRPGKNIRGNCPATFFNDRYRANATRWPLVLLLSPPELYFPRQCSNARWASLWRVPIWCFSLPFFPFFFSFEWRRSRIAFLARECKSRDTRKKDRFDACLFILFKAIVYDLKYKIVFFPFFLVN